MLSYYTNCTPLEDDVCPICLDDKSDDHSWCMINKCKHKYHITCIDLCIPQSNVQKNCPQCMQCIY